MDWFLYDNGLRHERVKLQKHLCLILNFMRKGIGIECINVSKLLRLCIVFEIRKTNLQILQLYHY